MKQHDQKPREKLRVSSITTYSLKLGFMKQNKDHKCRRSPNEMYNTINEMLHFDERDTCQLLTHRICALESHVDTPGGMKSLFYI